MHCHQNDLAPAFPLLFQKCPNGLNVLLDRRWWRLRLKVRLCRESRWQCFHPIRPCVIVCFRNEEGTTENRNGWCLGNKAAA